MEILPDVQFHEDLWLVAWRPRGILDEAAVNKVLVDQFRRETMAAKPFNRYCDLSAIESCHLAFKYVFHVALHRRLSYAGRAPVKAASYRASKLAYFLCFRRGCFATVKKVVLRVQLRAAPSLPMNWITITWAMAASACVTLAVPHLAIWVKRRSEVAHLLFALCALG